jgi:transcriptional regulator with XRE-family HTH domain
MNYGKALRVGRALAGLQQADVARLSGLNQSHISLVEQGKRRPSVRTIEKLSRALGMPTHLFTMLAAEPADLDGVRPREFGAVADSLARLILTDRGPVTGGKRKRHSLAP